MQTVLPTKLTVCTAEVIFQIKGVFSWLSQEKNVGSCIIM